MADIDQVNMFGNAEWDAIRPSIDSAMTEIHQWTEWLHRQPSEVILPSGETVLQNRGAAQGDAFGSYQAAATQAKARAGWACATDGTKLKGACDEWYIDDGQLVIRPELLDPWLRAFDAAIARYGATRGSVREGNAKSSCRLYCRPEQMHLTDGWCTEYVRSTMHVLAANETTAALGAPFGDDSALESMVDSTMAKIRHKRTALLAIDHAPTELVLTRLCADVGLLAYHTRLNGDRVAAATIQAHDDSLRASLESILGGSMPEDAWEQATLPVRAGGLGLRHAEITALPAFLASRLASRPHVMSLARHLEEAELVDVDTFMAAYDARTTAARDRFFSNLSPHDQADMEDCLRRSQEHAANTWNQLFAEEPDNATVEPLSEQRRPHRPGHTILPADEDEDENHPDASPNGLRARIQKEIMLIVEERKVSELNHSMADAGNVSGVHRLADLQHEEQDHSWLWSLSPHRGPTMQSEVFVEAVRLRLGMAGPKEATPCHLYGDFATTETGAHALCCARAQSTRGHHALNRFLFDEISTFDPAAEFEPAHLIPGTLLRPADILTSGVGAGLTALDVGVISPDATSAGADCVITMFERKVAKYAAHEAALERQNISYLPLVFSSYGRPHPSSTATLRALAKRAARRRGCGAREWRYRRLRSKVSLLLWTRAGKMVMSCWPDGEEQEGD